MTNCPPTSGPKSKQWLAASPEHRQLLAELAALRSDLHSLPRLSLGEDFAQRVVAAAVARQPATSATVTQKLLRPPSLRHRTANAAA